jgi:hypothetical protein
MTETPRLEASLREHLVPVLRAEGFSGSGRTFRRVIDEFVEVVSVQGSRYGGQFAVNLAIHPLSIPDVLGEIPDPKRITEELCEFRRRLSESGADQWWKHEGTRDTMDMAVKAAAAVYRSKGSQLLENVLVPLYSLTPEAFESGQYDLQGFGSTKVRMALALARFRQAKGRAEEAKKFAAIGLAAVGNAPALRKALEHIGE